MQINPPRKDKRRRTCGAWKNEGEAGVSSRSPIIVAKIDRLKTRFAALERLGL